MDCPETSIENDLDDINRCRYILPSMTRRKLYNFYIDADLAEGLKVVKDQTGAPEAETIRRALKAYLVKAGIIKTERKRAVTRKRP